MLIARSFELLAQLRRQNLHVAREHDQVAAFLVQDLEQAFLLLAPCCSH